MNGKSWILILVLAGAFAWLFAIFRGQGYQLAHLERELAAREQLPPSTAVSQISSVADDEAEALRAAEAEFRRLSQHLSVLQGADSKSISPISPLLEEPLEQLRRQTPP